MKTSKRPLSILALSAGLLVAGCATGQATPGTMVSLPDGSQTVYHRKSSGSYGTFDGQVQWTQKAMDWQGRKVVANSSAQFGASYFDAATHGMVASFNATGQQTYAYDPPVGFVFPLEVGKAWVSEHKMTAVRNNQVLPMTVSYKIETLEDVTVPAGSYKAYKVVFTDSFGETTTQWSAPQLGLGTIKRISVRNTAHPLGAGQLQAELLSVKKP
jgi:hypothetical protein